MSLPVMIKNHLDASAVEFATVTREQLNGEARSLLQKTAKSVVLQDTDGLVLAVIPADRSINLDAVQKHLGRKIDFVPPRDYVTLFKDWAPSQFSPFATNYGLCVLVDSSLAELETVYFDSGTTDTFIRVGQDAFRKLHTNADFNLSFAQPMNAASAAPAKTATPSPTPAKTAAPSLKFNVEKITELPPMPDMAHKIVTLNANPYARVQDLAAIVELDPSLSAQIVRYARSAFFGYRGRINSIHEAIARVLGYDLVMNIALGIAAAAPFKHSRKGPLGLDAYWKHATYSAILAQSLSTAVGKGVRPRQGMAYLAGLLHNFGFVVLGHLDTSTFNTLNDAVAANPETPVVELERSIVGATHTEIGAWLMQAWNMPGEVITTVKEHHNADYAGNFAPYVHLIRLVDHLLKRFELGDAPDSNLPVDAMQSLGITPTQIDTKLNKLLEAREELDHIAQTLAA